MKPIFTGSSYNTPADTRRRWLDKLFLNTRWYFVSGYLNEVIKACSLALKGSYNKEAWVKSSYNILKLIEGCGGRIHLRGLENLRTCRGPVVFVSNHMSTLETFVFPCIIAPVMDVTFIVKKSLVKMPVFGPVMRSRKPIVVGRDNPRDDFQTVMTEGKKLLEQGTSIIVFPQSTRSVNFNPREFNTMGIKLAKAAGVQVIPVAIKTDFWGNGKILKDFGAICRNKPVHMVFGAPFTVTGNGKEEHQHVVNFVIDNLRKMDAF